MPKTKLILAVVGPNGSGKSSALYRSKVNERLLFINPDDVARNEFLHISSIEERNKLAWDRCNELRDELVKAGVSFGFETVGSHPSKVELLQHAKELGYRVALLFVATESPEINIERIKHRVLQGGHNVPDDKVRARYVRTLKLLPEYFALADTASVWDNSQEGTSETPAIRLLVEKEDGDPITITPDAADVAWIKEYLLSDLLKPFSK